MENGLDEQKLSQPERSNWETTFDFLVATNDANIEPGRRESHEVLLCIQTNNHGR
jgi:DNA polymerase III alpha subunit